MEAWSCPECRTANPRNAALCGRCGITKRHLEDPPVDIPFTPGYGDLPATYLAALWGSLLAGGLILLASPALLDRIGLPLPFVAIEVFGAALATFGALQSLFWQRRLNQFEVDLPAQVPSGVDFEVAVTAVPYASLTGASLEVTLVDRFYHRSGDGKLQTKTRRLGSVRALERGALRGRRENAFRVRFVAPFPATRHEDLMAEIGASLIGLFSWFVPGAAEAARNLREHGGYYVRVRLTIGLFSKVVERRVISYHLGNDLFIG